MSMVRFATICDQCGKRSEEYAGWGDCRECGDDVCPADILPGTFNEETGKCLCRRCSAESVSQKRDTRHAEATQ
jgi:hypothetical protein